MSCHLIKVSTVCGGGKGGYTMEGVLRINNYRIKLDPISDPFGIIKAVVPKNQPPSVLKEIEIAFERALR